VTFVSRVPGKTLKVRGSRAVSLASHAILGVEEIVVATVEGVVDGLRVVIGDWVSLRKEEKDLQ